MTEVRAESHILQALRESKSILSKVKGGDRIRLEVALYKLSKRKESFLQVIPAWVTWSEFLGIPVMVWKAFPSHFDEDK